MTGRTELAAVMACCAGKALLLTGVLLAGGTLTTRPWLIGAAITVAVIVLWHSTVALRRREQGS